MMRKLATIRRIGSITKIPGADNIETVTVDGWENVVRKGEYHVNQIIVFIETDAFLKVKEPFLFLHNVQGCLKKNAENEQGFKIRVHQMGPKKTPENDALGYVKQTSNGLVLPLSDFEKIVPGIRDMPVDTDLTGQIGAKVFEPFVVESVKDVAYGGMPSSIKTTDQERIQNVLVYFSKYRDITFEVTEKINGASTTFYFMDRVQKSISPETMPRESGGGSFGVCNRTLDLKNVPRASGGGSWDYAIAHGIENAMREYAKIPHENWSGSIALQGELAGEGIQKNTLQLKGIRFFLFDVWDIDNRRYLTPPERKAVFDWFKAKCGIEHVPIVDPCATIDPDGSISRVQAKIAQIDLDHAAGTVDDAQFEKSIVEINTVIHYNVKKFVEMANGDSIATPGRNREGLVFKSNELVNGQTVSFKVISDAYKLKYEG